VTPAAECIFRKGLLRGVTMPREDDFTSSDRAFTGSLYATFPEGTWRVGLTYHFQEARSLTGAGFFFAYRFPTGFLYGRCFMLLQDRLNQRIANAIRDKIDFERAEWDTTSDAWRTRCEIAQVASFGDTERSVFIHQVIERRGTEAADEIQSQATKLRTAAIFFLASSKS
jgi:hypothetical protein